MPSLTIETDKMYAPELRSILNSYAPRLSYSEQSGWLWRRFTITGEDPYLSNAASDIEAWQARVAADNAW